MLMSVTLASANATKAPPDGGALGHAAPVSVGSSVLVVVVAVLGVLVVTVDVVDMIVVRHGLMTARRAVLVLGDGVLCVDFSVSHGWRLSHRVNESSKADACTHRNALI